MNTNLSGSQFGAVRPTAPSMMPEPHTPVLHAAPLPLSNHTNSSAELAAVWRKPKGEVLPLSSSTSTSLFTPTL